LAALFCRSLPSVSRERSVPPSPKRDLDRLIAEAIDATKHAYQVTPGIEGTSLN
jgi:hypothetical protein